MTKADWFRLLESNGGTAVIVVLLGTFAGSILNGCIQGSLTKRDFRLAAYERRIAQERIVVEQLYGLVGNSIIAADTLLALTGEPYNLRRYSASDREVVREQTHRLIEDSNAKALRWRAQEPVLSLQVSYYAGSRGHIDQYWANVSVAVDTLLHCAEKYYYRYQNGQLAIDSSTPSYGSEVVACESERADALSSLNLLTSRLGEAAQNEGLLSRGE